MDIKTFKEVFDPILRDYIDIKNNQAKELLNDQRINSYIDYIQNFIFSGGKRIRPYVMRLTYRGFGGKFDEDAMKFAIVFELLHSMALIHDDVIDQADKRHNIPSMHKYIATKLTDGRGRVGESQAILIGDLIFSRVYELSNKEHNFPSNLLTKARENLHSMIEEVILGQMIDVDMMAGDQAPYELIEKKCYYKTASYTFIRPMLCGAIFADTAKDNMELTSELGKYLGLAFQLRDDMMDITFGDPTKSPFSDIQEGQQTYFTNYVFTHGTQEQKGILHGAMGNRLNTKQILDLQNIFKESGALSSGEKLLQEYSNQAKNALEKISFQDNIAKEGFTLLIQKLAKI
ncbi:MAG: polyprenyl synthetase family protein [Candidatus Absconditabacteria bacterium]|nr:polyprenyl synthetase family protein [Candidatus Absconditabacteria bacterium]